MNIENIIKKLKLMVDQGEESHFIDKALDNEKLPKEFHSQVFRIIQEYQVNVIKEKTQNEVNINAKILGWSLVIFGLAITIGTFLMRTSVFIIAYGAILIGIWVIYKKKFSVEMFDSPDPKTQNKSVFDKGLFKKF